MDNRDEEDKVNGEGNVACCCVWEEMGVIGMGGYCMRRVKGEGYGRGDKGRVCKGREWQGRGEWGGRGQVMGKDMEENGIRVC